MRSLSLYRRLFIIAIFLFGSFGLAFQATAQSKPPLKIGFSMALTGPLASNGKAALLSMEIWREDINKKVV